MRHRSVLFAFLALGCSGQEATRVQLPVEIGTASESAVTTDLGYRVTLDHAKFSVADLLFTVDGGHAGHSVSSALWSLVGGTAHAHPGHFGGGVVGGELLGEHILDWMDPGALVGTATLVASSYTGCDFLLRNRPGADLGGGGTQAHAISLAGTATLDDHTHAFSATVVIDDDTVVRGVPFSTEIDESSSGPIHLELRLLDPFEMDTLFDGIDFGAQASDQALVIEPGSSEHNLLKRRLQAHDHYFVSID